MSKPTTAIRIRNCVFGFQCAQKWDEMKETSRDEVRFCKECEKDVYLISGEEKLLEAILLNRCVAIEVPKDLDVSSKPKQKSEMILGMLTSYEERYGEPEPNDEFRKRIRNKGIV